MKKVILLSLVLMMIAFVTAVQAQVRAGGLAPIVIDDTINDCDCRLFPQCCPQPAPAPVPEPAPAPAPPPPPPAPVEERVSMVLNVLFDTDKSVVKDQYYDDVNRLADFMKTYPDSTVTIEGHTDSVGTDEYNKKLSEDRANSVRQFIIDKYGIDGSRLSAAGYGEEDPIDTNDTAEGRQKNRRVEAVIEAVRIVK